LQTTDQYASFSHYIDCLQWTCGLHSWRNLGNWNGFERKAKQTPDMAVFSQQSPQRMFECLLKHNHYVDAAFISDFVTLFGRKGLEYCSRYSFARENEALSKKLDLLAHSLVQLPDLAPYDPQVSKDEVYHILHLNLRGWNVFGMSSALYKEVQCDYIQPNLLFYLLALMLMAVGFVGIALFHHTENLFLWSAICLTPAYLVWYIALMLDQPFQFKGCIRLTHGLTESHWKVAWVFGSIMIVACAFKGKCSNSLILF